MDSLGNPQITRITRTQWPARIQTLENPRFGSLDRSAAAAANLVTSRATEQPFASRLWSDHSRARMAHKSGNSGCISVVDR
jgi:hypothetical protein